MQQKALLTPVFVFKLVAGALAANFCFCKLALTFSNELVKVESKVEEHRVCSIVESSKV